MTDLAQFRHSYDSILFDIDGTLWNAAQTTADAWNEVFKSRRIDCPVSDQDIERVAGRPYLECLRLIFTQFDQYPDQEQLLADLAAAEKRTMLSQGGKLYSGVDVGLRALSGRFPLYLVSNCQDWYLEAFLNHQNMRKFFKDWTCFGLTQLPKDQNIRQLVAKNQLKRPLYFGDTTGDQKAAEQAQVDFFYASYGFEPQMALRVPEDRKFQSFPEFQRFFDPSFV